MRIVSLTKYAENGPVHTIDVLSLIIPSLRLSAVVMPNRIVCSRVSNHVPWAATIYHVKVVMYLPCNSVSIEDGYIDCEC